MTEKKDAPLILAPESKTEIIPGRSLHRKLAQVMYEAERIPKNGRAPKEMGGYPFVQVGDAADFIRKALSEKVITMMPVAVRVTGQVDRPTAKGGTMTTVDLVTTWRITDGESGEFIDIESFGAGADVGDKYSGKASTSAMKYALLTGFLLSTGEDSELGTAQAGRPQQPTGATQTAPGDSGQAQTPSGVVHAEGGLIGIASLGKSAPVDGELRTSAKPHGWKCSHGYTQAHQTGSTGDVYCDEVNVREPEDSVGFVIGEGRDKVQVVAYGPKASGLAPLLASEVIGQRVQVFGPTSPETMTVRGRAVDFLRVRLELLVTPEARFDFREPAQPTDEQMIRAAASEDGAVQVARELARREPVLPEPPEDVELMSEAETKPLGLIDDVA